MKGMAGETPASCFVAICRKPACLYLIGRCLVVVDEARDYRRDARPKPQRGLLRRIPAELWSQKADGRLKDSPAKLIDCLIGRSVDFRRQVFEIRRAELTAEPIDMKRHEVVPVFGHRPQNVLAQRRSLGATRSSVPPDFGQQVRIFNGPLATVIVEIELSGDSLYEPMLQYGDSGFFQSKLLSDLLISPVSKKQEVKRLEILKTTISFQSVC